MSVCSKFQIKVLTGPLAGLVLTEAVFDQFITDHAGNGYTYAVLRGMVTDASMTEAQMIAYEEALCAGGVDPDPEPGEGYTAYQGIGAIPTNEAGISAGIDTLKAIGSPSITLTYASVAEPSLYWFAVPVTEAKTEWFVDILNNGDIGAPAGPDAWQLLDVIEVDGVDYNLYATSFETEYSSPIQFND